MSDLRDRWEFARTVAQGIASVYAVGKAVAETVRVLAKRRDRIRDAEARAARWDLERDALCSRIEGLKSELSQALGAKDRVEMEHKDLSARLRAHLDRENPPSGVDPFENVTFLRKSDEEHEEG